MKKLVTYIVGFVLVGLAFLSCKTDFDINAPYKPIPIIYGLLDQSKDTQFVKINKSFIGDGNNVDYASINDSLLFSNVSARVEQYAPGLSSPFKLYDLQELWVGNLQSGIFYEDSQKVYYFVPDAPLDDEHMYQLVVSVDDLQEDITAQTYLIGDDLFVFDFLFSTAFTSNIPGSPTVGGLKLADHDASSDGNYYSPLVKWKSAPRGKIYDLNMYLNYDEVSVSGDTLTKAIFWNLGTQRSIGNGEALNGGNDLTKSINGLSFYNMIKNRLSSYPNESSVLSRIYRGIDFVVVAGNEDLNTYIEVNEPATGVVTERPAFTNIDGDGIGLFASKNSISISGKLDLGSLVELCQGEYTSGFKFCTDNPDWVTPTLGNVNYNLSCN